MNGSTSRPPDDSFEFIRLRTALFHPIEGIQDCPVDLSTILETRKTYVEPTDGQVEYQVQDNWQNDPTSPYYENMEGENRIPSDAGRGRRGTQENKVRWTQPSGEP